MSFEEWWSEHGEGLWLADPDMLTRKDYARVAYEAGRKEGYEQAAEDCYQ